MTERVVCKKHPERKTIGGSFSCKNAFENHSRAVVPKIVMIDKHNRIPALKDRI